MSDPLYSNRFERQDSDSTEPNTAPADVDLRRTDVSLRGTTLPEWLARRVLKPEENIAWVCAPYFTPSWERYFTHPLVAVAGMLLGVAVIVVCGVTADKWAEISPVGVLIGGTLSLGTLFVVGCFCGYFTRLVVTDQRIFIVQGYEVRHSWSMDRLPPSLWTYQRRDRDGERTRAVDLDALKTMLGNSGSSVADAKTIRNFGKHLSNITSRDQDR